MSTKRSMVPLLWFALILAAMLGQALVPAHSDRRLWAALLDAGHVPLFALLAVVLLRLAKMILGRRPRLLHYLLTFMVVAFVGVLTEGMQALVDRDADKMDLARNLLGGAAGLLFVAGFDGALLPARSARWPLRAIAWILALGLLVVAFEPLASTLLGYRDRDASFPTLLDFEHPRILQFVTTRNAELEVTSPPPSWSTPEGNHVARVTYAPVEYPVLILREPRGDWSGYDRLVFEVYSEQANPSSLTLRIDDESHNERYYDRFNRSLSLEPGYNRVVISLDEVRQAPRQREMNLSRMHSLALFAGKPSEAVTYWIDGFRLEK